MRSCTKKVNIRAWLEHLCSLIVGSGLHECALQSPSNVVMCIHAHFFCAWGLTGYKCPISLSGVRGPLAHHRKDRAMTMDLSRTALSKVLRSHQLDVEGEFDPGPLRSRPFTFTLTEDGWRVTRGRGSWWDACGPHPLAVLATSTDASRHARWQAAQIAAFRMDHL